MRWLFGWPRYIFSLRSANESQQGRNSCALLRSCFIAMLKLPWPILIVNWRILGLIWHTAYFLRHSTNITLPNYNRPWDPTNPNDSFLVPNWKLWVKMFHIFHVYSLIWFCNDAISSAKKCLNSVLLLSTDIDGRTAKFFACWMLVRVNSNFMHASFMQVKALLAEQFK